MVRTDPKSPQGFFLRGFDIVNCVKICRMFEPKVRHLFEVPLRTCFSNQPMMKLMVSKFRSAGVKYLRYFRSVFCLILNTRDLNHSYWLPRVLYTMYNPVNYLRWHPSFGRALFYNLIELTSHISNKCSYIAKTLAHNMFLGVVWIHRWFFRATKIVWMQGRCPGGGRVLPYMGYI